MAMGREGGEVAVGDAGDHVAEHRAIGFGGRIADRIGQVDRAGARGDRDLDRAAEEIRLGAGRILGRPFDVRAQVARQPHGALDRLEDLLGGLVELDPHMERRGRNESMDAGSDGMLHRFPGTLDIGIGGARQACDGRALALPGDLGNRLEIAGRGDREAGLDDVDAHRLQLGGNLQFFLEVHRTAG